MKGSVTVDPRVDLGVEGLAQHKVTVSEDPFPFPRKRESEADPVCVVLEGPDDHFRSYVVGLPGSRSFFLVSPGGLRESSRPHRPTPPPSIGVPETTPVCEGVGRLSQGGDCSLHLCQVDGRPHGLVLDTLDRGGGGRGHTREN